MTWSIEFWVEGPHDESVLPHLTLRTLAELGGTSREEIERSVSVHCRKLKEVLRPLVGLPGTGKMEPMARKLLFAFEHRSVDTLAVAIWDEDGKGERLRIRDQVNEYLVRHGMSGAAAGVCIQTLEAWLLVDPSAFKACFGCGPDSGLPGKPEDSPNPKIVLSEVLSALGVDACAESYAALAKSVQLQVLADKCARSYKVFRDDMNRLVVPKLATRPPN